MNEETPAENTGDNWLILNCPGCEKEVKLRSGTDLGAAACPYCSEFLGDPSPANDDGSTGTSDPADEKSPADDDGSEVEKDWQGDEPARIKRRSKPPATVEEPEWDRDPDAPKRRDDDDTTEFVEVDPDNPDAIRVRRVKRTKLVTPAQKLFRISLLAFLLLVGAGGLTLLIIAIVQGTSTVTKDIQTVAELPEEINRLIAEASPKDGVIPTVLTENETKAALEILTGYLEADGWEAKLPYVYKPERARERMQKWYASPDHSDAPIPVREIAMRDKIVEGDGERFVIKIAIETYPGDYRIFALRQTTDDIKIHWESSVGYQEMTLKEFLDTPSNEPVPFRVFLTPDTYYAFAYSDSSKYRCFRMTYPGDLSFNLYGYVDRSDESMQELLNMATMSALVLLQSDSKSKQRNQVQILRVIEESWFE